MHHNLHARIVEEVRKVLSQVLTSSASTKALAKQESSTIGKGDGYDYYASDNTRPPLLFTHMRKPLAYQRDNGRNVCCVTLFMVAIACLMAMIVMPGAFRIGKKFCTYRISLILCFYNIACS